MRKVLTLDEAAEILYDKMHLPASGITIPHGWLGASPATQSIFRKLMNHLIGKTWSNIQGLRTLWEEILDPKLGGPRFSDSYYALVNIGLAVEFLNVTFGWIGPLPTTKSDAAIPDIDPDKIYIFKASKRKFKLVKKTADKVEFKYLDRDKDTIYEMSIDDMKKETKELD